MRCFCQALSCPFPRHSASILPIRPIFLPFPKLIFGEIEARSIRIRIARRRNSRLRLANPIRYRVRKFELEHVRNAANTFAADTSHRTRTVLKRKVFRTPDPSPPTSSTRPPSCLIPSRRTFRRTFRRPLRRQFSKLSLRQHRGRLLTWKHLLRAVGIGRAGRPHCRIRMKWTHSRRVQFPGSGLPVHSEQLRHRTFLRT